MKARVGFPARAIVSPRRRIAVVLSGLALSLTGCTAPSPHVSTTSRPSGSASTTPIASSPTSSPKFTLVIEKGIGAASWSGPTQLYTVTDDRWTPYLTAGEYPLVPATRRPTLEPSNDGRLLALEYP